jgi:hypothetical protein
VLRVISESDFPGLGNPRPSSPPRSGRSATGCPVEVQFGRMAQRDQAFQGIDHHPSLEECATPGSVPERLGRSLPGKISRDRGIHKIDLGSLDGVQFRDPVVFQLFFDRWPFFNKSSVLLLTNSYFSKVKSRTVLGMIFKFSSEVSRT